VTDTSTEDPEHARKLVAHSLVAFAQSVPKEHVPIAMALLIPALLSRASSQGGSEDTSLYHETSTRLLELAAADQAGFRNVVSAMSGEQKAFMEVVISSGKSQGSLEEPEAGEEDTAEPSIALKMNFGGS
jgi:hypothetical protein